MNYVKNKTLYVETNDGDCEVLEDIVFETLWVQDLENIGSRYSYDNYKKIIKDSHSIICIGVYFLNSDETIEKDISEFVSSINLSMSYKQGETRNGNIKLINHKNEWNPSPVNGGIWQGKKIRIDIGFYNDGVLIWNNMGIYVIKTPTYTESDKTLTIELHDKFSLLDGSIGGKTMYTYKINVGTTIETAIINTLKEDRGNGDWIDVAQPLFFTELQNTKTPYTLTKPPNSTYGDLITDLCNMISCDVYYNEYGNLIIEDGLDNVEEKNKPVLWEFEDGDMTCSAANIDVNFSDVVNWVTVVGQIANGTQYKATVKNEDPNSQSNIYMMLPKPLYIEDKNIVGNSLCEARARWELKKQRQIGVQLNFKSIFIPHLIPNTMVTYTNKDYGWYKERFLINSISYSLSSENPYPIMNLSLANVNEVIFNGIK